MAILDIGGKSVVNANRLRGYKGEGERKGGMPARDHAMSHSGGLLDFWLKPLVASGYDYQATERKTGIDARHMRRVVAVMSRMEYEAEALCPAAAKAKMGERVRARAGTPSSLHKPKRTATGKDWFVTDAEIEAVYKLHVVAGFLQRETAERLGITRMRVQVICRAARRGNRWPSEGKAVAS